MRQSSVRLLLVNNDRDENHLAKRLLQFNRYHAESAQTLAEARARLLSGRFSLLLCPNILPDGFGSDLIRFAWEELRVPTLPLIAPVPLQVIRDSVERIQVSPECLRGRLYIPCEKAEFVDAVAKAIRCVPRVAH